MMCQVCKGKGFLTFGEGMFAQARLCSCRSPCPLCGGTGFALDADGKAKRCECTLLAQRLMLFNSAKIPAIMHDKSIETYRELGGNQAIVKLNMMRYMQSFPPTKNKGLLLWGGTGVGKTHLVCSLAKYLTLNLGHSVAYTTFEDTVPLFRQAIMEGESIESVIPALVSADCFILEDIGEGTVSEFRLHCLDMCVSTRYNAGKILVVTTRFPPESQNETPSLKERVGERVFSRLCEMCEFLQVSGPDYRRRSGGLVEEM